MGGHRAKVYTRQVGLYVAAMFANTSYNQGSQEPRGLLNRFSKLGSSTAAVLWVPIPIPTNTPLESYYRPILPMPLFSASAPISLLSNRSAGIDSGGKIYLMRPTYSGTYRARG